MRSHTHTHRFNIHLPGEYGKLVAPQLTDRQVGLPWPIRYCSLYPSNNINYHGKGVLVQFLQAKCTSCNTTNRIKALKGQCGNIHIFDIQKVGNIVTVFSPKQVIIYLTKIINYLTNIVLQAVMLI